MNSSHLNRFKRLFVLGAVVSCALASAAGASASGVRGISAPDVFERYAAAHPFGSIAVPDVLERYAVAHPYGVGSPAPQGTDRIVDDWFRDPAKVTAPVRDRIVDDSFRDPAPIVTPAGERIVDDSFRDAPTVVNSTPSGSGLDWEDFGIGAGAMLGLTVLVSGLGVGAAVLRHRGGGRLETS